MTMAGELVYQKSVLSFKDKKCQVDCILEENLLDVKRLLKNSAFSQNQMKDQTQNEDKSLVNVSVKPFY